MNKLKIINDPVYGFINIPYEILFDIIQHPHFQRLRRIKQLGLTNYVYPGASHTRFDHVLGATHLMNVAIKELRLKNADISDEEHKAALIAILMHDLGHGPFSHTLEHSFVKNISHEEISLAFMKKFNEEMNGELDLGIKIFTDNYPKKFLHSLVSSQLDTDRLDYLRRDSFYTGVTEGNIGSERILKMLRVVNDEIAVEEKGIYSIEKFLGARRIMYWQVYLHKTVVAAEQMLLKTIERARKQSKENGVYATASLSYFFDNNIFSSEIFHSKKLLPSPLDAFAKLDDTDIIVSLKEWSNSEDYVLAELSKRLINRNLFKLEIQNKPYEEAYIHELRKKVSKYFKISEEDSKYFVFSESIKNKAYSTHNLYRINILLKSGKLADIAEASDISNIATLSETVEKYFLCYPKECI
jgi:HD superfamily phosphohydrolase